MPVGRIYEPPPRFLSSPSRKGSFGRGEAEDFKSISIPIKVQVDVQNGSSFGSSPEDCSSTTTTVISVPIRILKEPSPIRATIKIPAGASGSQEPSPVSTSRPLSIPIIRTSPSRNGEEKEEGVKAPSPNREDSNGHDINNNDCPSMEKETEKPESPHESTRLTFIQSDHAKGLRNLGNTCFMNSTLQCLAHCGKLLGLIHSGNFSKGGKRDLTDSFVDVLNDLWSIGGYNAGRATVDPSKFKGEIGSFAPKFSGYNQHDSQEFLQYLLEGIHNELNRVDPATRKRESKRMAEKTKEEEREEALLDPIDFGIKSFANYLLRDNSPVTDLFMGQFRSTLKCLTCKNESVTFEPFWVVSLPIPPKSSQPKLEDCFRLFTKEEVLDGEEKPFCEKCDKTRQKSAKWYTFERWPQVLVVHFKRFESSRFRSKISSHIDVPVKNMSVGEFSSGKGFVSYDCFGISNHSGSLGGGHYTAYGRHPVDHSKWHLYNDSFVSKAGGDAVVSHEAYLLFFEKR